MDQLQTDNRPRPMDTNQDIDPEHATTPFRTRNPKPQVVLSSLPIEKSIPNRETKEEYTPVTEAVIPDIPMEIDNPPMVASVAASDFNSPDYNTQYSSRGRALIILNLQYYDDEERRPRKGSKRDAEALEKTFKEMKFEPIRTEHNSDPKYIHENLNRQQIKELLQKATDPSLNDYTNADCFMCVVLAYGIEGAFLTCEGYGDELMDANEVIEPFLGSNCKSLLMKPKLFFMQCCPPYEKTMADAGAIDSEVFDNKKSFRMSLPTHADVLVQYSGLPGMYGWIRNRRQGMSWYVESLVKALQKFCIDRMRRHRGRSVEFSSIMTRVNKFIEDIIEREGLGLSEEFGIPTIKSTLTKNLYFYPKENAIQVQDESAP